MSLSRTSRAFHGRTGRALRTQYIIGRHERSLSPESTRHIKVSVAEIYSPPRITKAATARPRLGIEAGAALVIATCDERGVPWDFTKEDMQRKAEVLIHETKPDSLVGSPMCTKCSSWQRINRRRAKDHLASRAEGGGEAPGVRVPPLPQAGGSRPIVSTRAPCSG